MSEPLKWDDFENGVSDLLAKFENKELKWHQFITQLYKIVYGVKP